MKVVPLVDGLAPSLWSGALPFQGHRRRCKRPGRWSVTAASERVAVASIGRVWMPGGLVKKAHFTPRRSLLTERVRSAVAFEHKEASLRIRRRLAAPEIIIRAAGDTEVSVVSDPGGRESVGVHRKQRLTR